MYKSYFGLREAPFAISPNPRYLYMSELHREALAHLLYGIRSDGCMILLTGGVGTGKTTLCRCLMEQLPEDTEVAVILNPRLSARELLRTVCEELSLLPGNTTGSIKTYVDAINTYLLQAHAADRTIAIIVDEAQNLAVDVLEQLRLLTNLETPTRKLLRILLLGQPELRDMLERPELAQVNQRITSRYHLTPLQSPDASNYIQHRLRVAGDNSGTLFTEKAIRHAISLTGGVPRLINILCDRALLGAYAINAEKVDLKIMKRAGEEIFPNRHKKRRQRTSAAVVAAVFAAILLLPAVIFIPNWLAPDPPTNPPVITAPPAQPAQPIQQVVPPAPPVQQQDAGQMENLQTPPVQPPADNPAKTLSGTADSATANLTGEQQASSSTAQKEAKKIAPEAPPVTQQQVETTDRPVWPGKKGQTPAVQSGETDKAAAPAPPTSSATTTRKSTITISAPLLVVDKAGPAPEKTAQELLTR